MWQDIKLGLLGGGQLGAMLVGSAIDFGLKVSVLDKHQDAPAEQYTSVFSVGDPMCYETVLTIEMEAVNVKALHQVVQESVKVHPSPSVIEVIQDKWTQKNALKTAGIPVVPGILVANPEALYIRTDKLPGCLKRCTQGYDGKGVMIVRTPADIAGAFDAPCVLEEFIEIEQELSVIVSRNAAGQIECYDPVAMIFDKERFVLDFQVSPACTTPQVAITACNIAIQVAENLNLVGILAVELFLTKDGRVLVNELAPRPHNSGHHTIEASATSQFEQHLRAIPGFPIRQYPHAYTIRHDQYPRACTQISGK